MAVAYNVRRGKLVLDRVGFGNNLCDRLAPYSICSTYRDHDVLRGLTNFDQY